MCSIGEDDFGDDGGVHAMQNDFAILELNDASNVGGICKKCEKYETIVKINLRDAECKECFLLNVRHKFRATLGSSKLLPKNANVLLIIDGYPESIVLLDMINFSLNQDNFKKLRCNVKILYIDDDFLQKNNENTNIQEIKNILKNYNDLEAYIISLTSTNGKPMKFNEYEKLNLNNEQNIFRKNFDSIQNLTSKQDFIIKKQRKIIRLTAQELNCNYIFLSDISSDLATTFLTNISLGAGSSVALDVSLLDDRTPQIKIIRPIKDLIDNEISYYIQLKNLKYLKKIKYGEENDSLSSIQNLTKEFVKNLQKNFPSTVSTIFRTGDKITSNRTLSKVTTINSIQNESITEFNGITEEHNKICDLCNSQLDTIKSNTLEAIEFSKLVSTKSLKNIQNIDNVNMINLNEFEINTPQKNLCHTCKNIFQDTNCKELFNDILL